MGIDSRRWALAAVAADLRGTGYPDLFVANDYGVSEVYFNEGGKRFREAGKETGIGAAPKSGMNASVGDVLNQGRFGIYVSNISEEGVLVQGNNFWMPRAGTSGANIRYDNMATAMGVDLGGWSFGAQFGDLNNDGFLDLYVVNGNVSLDRNRSYWYDYSKVAGGNQAIISDAANWPPLDGRSLSGYQQKRVWINDGAGQFKEVAQLVGVTDVYDGRSIALADFGNRGALDAVVANESGPLLLYRNTVSPDNRWIEFELEGRESNRSAIGAQVRVTWNGQQQVQEVSGGSGFCAQNQRRLHFGLGKTTGIDKVEIRWPSGKTADDRRAVDWTKSIKRWSRNVDRSSRRTRQARLRVGTLLQRRESLSLAAVHHPDPAGGEPFVRLAGELLAHAAGHRHGAGAGGCVRALVLGQDSEPGQRLHYRHQCRHPAALAGILAVCALQRHRHHFQVRGARAAGATSGILRTLRFARCCLWRLSLWRR